MKYFKLKVSGLVCLVLIGVLFCPNTASARRIRNPQGIYNSVKDLLGKFQTATTFQTLFDTLGIFQEGVRIQYFPSDTFKGITFPYLLGDNQKAGYIPFALDNRGKNFFQELLKLDSIDSKAYLLIYEDEQRRPNGMKTLPYGMLFKDTKTQTLFFFDFTWFFLNEEAISFLTWNMVSMSSSILFPEVPDKFPGISDAKPIRKLRLVKEKTLSKGIPIEKKLEREFGFDGKFELLSIIEDKNVYSNEENFDDLGLFSSRDPYSQDFQEVLCQNAGLIKDKRVIEIGVGSGINVLYALKFGAKSVKATDISHVYVALSRWNLQYAQDTKQIEPISAGTAEIIQGNGFASLPSADIYLANFPSIRSKKETEELNNIHGQLEGISNFIPTDAFLGIFAELKQRLSQQPGAQAIMRILPSLESGLAELNGEDIEEYERQSRGLRGNTEVLKCVILAERFLKNQGFQPQKGVKAKNRGRGLFLLEYKQPQRKGAYLLLDGLM